MSDQIKMGLIIGAAIIIATGMWIYFSPYQTCIRSVQTGNAAYRCAAVLTRTQ